MVFTYKEIIALENPYEQLSDGDALAENAKVLNALSTKEQLALATKIIAACPESKFKQYSNHIKALDNFAKNGGTFHEVLRTAHLVRQHINSLHDLRNKSPHALFLAKDFDPAPFHRFSDLATQVLESNESAIAERLALCTPEKERSKIAHTLSTVFPKSILAAKIQLAFTLRRNIETLLLSDNPEKFFTSRDYKAETCKTFVNMFSTLLQGHEASIAGKLSTLESTHQASIQHELELLHSEAFDETNPFRVIADSISAKESAKTNKNGSQAGNPSGFLYKKSPTPLLRVKSLPLEEFESGSDADDELSQGKTPENKEEEEYLEDSSSFTPH